MIIKIVVELYSNASVLFIIGENPDKNTKKAVSKYLGNYIPLEQRYVEIEEGNAAQTLTFENCGKNIVILSENFEYHDMVHEVFHATCSICRFVHISLSESSEEAFAYLQSYIIKKLTNEIQRIKKIS